MLAKPNPIEEGRLNELYAYGILDTESTQEFDDLVHLASSVAGTPISLITLVDKNRQWFKAKLGIVDRETPKESSFCAKVVEDREEHFIVHDAHTDERFRNYASVTGDPHVRFYAGFPLITETGNRLGTLCVIDHVPRFLSSDQLQHLQMLSRQAMRLIDLNLRNKEISESRNQVTEKNNQLKRLLANQRKLITILAHDTRGPLYSMRQMLRLFMDGMVPAEETQKIYGLLQEQNDVTISMVEGLVKWGQAYLKTADGTATAPDMQAIVADVFKQYKPNATLKGIELIEQVSDKECLKLSGEVVSFIIRNLVNNAVKYTDGGTVKVMARRSGTYYELLVSDTGIGMSKHTVKDLFKGQTSSKQGTRGESGSGLGLILVNDFVEQSGGEISVKSQAGKGTTVKVKLPCE